MITFKSNSIALTSFKDDDSQLLYEWINNEQLVTLSSAYRPVEWDSHCSWFEAAKKMSSSTWQIFAIRL